MELAKSLGKEEELKEFRSKIEGILKKGYFA